MKHKKWWKYLATGAGVASIIAAVSITTISCTTAKSPSQTTNTTPNSTIQGNNTDENVMTAANKNPALQISTPQFVQKVLGTTSGQTALVDQYAQYAVYEWFKNSKNPVVQSIYQQQLTNAQKQYQNQYKTYSGQGNGWQNNFQQQVLDPAGGSEQSYVYQTLVKGLMTQFTNLVMPSNFVQTYLSILSLPGSSGSGNSNNVPSATAIASSNVAISTVDEPGNVNGITIGSTKPVTTNMFLFASSTPGIDQGYTNFLNFAFDQWVKTTMPLTTPAILFTNGSNPSTSGLFNPKFFNAIPASGSYNFQYFTNKSSNIQQNTSANLYAEFLNGLTSTSSSNNSGSSSGTSNSSSTSGNTSATSGTQSGKTSSANTSKINYLNNSYINQSLGGAASFPLSLTQGHTTTFVTNVSNAYETYVAPFTAAIMYKLNNLVFGNGTGTGSGLPNNDMPTETNFFNESGVSQTIMGNFVSPTLTNTNTTSKSAGNNIQLFAKNGFATSETSSSPSTESSATGVFTFPYINGNNKYDPFTGAYGDGSATGAPGITGIRDTVNIPNSPFIITRDQFGVHVIAIDRWEAMRQAILNAGAQASPNAKMNALDTVIRNTILWRAAQNIVNDGTSINLAANLQKYISNNLDQLIVEYICNAMGLDQNVFVPNGLAQAEFEASEGANNALSSQPITSDTNNLFFGSWSNSNSWQDKFSTPFRGQSGTSYNFSDLFNAIQELSNLNTDDQAISTISQKIYANQNAYNETTNAKTWASYGVAGILPYARNTITGNYDSLDALILDDLPGFNTTNNAITVADVASDPNIPAQYLTAIQGQSGLNGAPITKLEYAQWTAKKTFYGVLTAFVNSLSPAGANSDYWDTQRFFTGSQGQTVIGQHNIVFMNSLLVNLAVENAQTNNKVITNVVNNALINADLDDVFDFATNQFTVGKNAVVPAPNATYSANNIKSISDLNGWIDGWVQNAIDSQYDLSNFTSQSNLYASGNWTNASQVEQIAETLTNNKIFANQMVVGTTGQVAQLNYEQNSSYYTFLETLAWLLDWNSTTNSFTFANLQDQLSDLVQNHQVAYLAWSFQNTSQFPVYLQNKGTWSSQTFGLTGSQYGSATATATENRNYNNAVNTAIQYDGAFKPNPLYLTNLTPYSFWGANQLTSTYGSGADYYNWAVNSAKDETLEEQSTFTTLSNYWNIAPVGTTTGTPITDATGFLGFQAANLGNSTLPSNFYAGEIFGNNIDNPNQNFTGALYQYNNGVNTTSGSTTTGSTAVLTSADPNDTNAYSYLEALINSTTSSSQLDSYAQVIQNCQFNFTPDVATDLSNILSGFSGSQPLSFSTEKSELIQDVLPNIPDQAFQPLQNQFMWGSSNGFSTLFPSTNSNQNALNTEYLLSEFNSNDVNNLTTNFQGTSTKTLNIGESGFLRANPQAFFDAVVLLAMNPSIQSTAQSSITNTEQETSNQVDVYDNRVAQVLGEPMVANWNDFENGGSN